MPINTSISTKNALILLTNCISNSCSEYSGDNSARSKVYSSLTANFACTLHSAGNVKSKFVWFNKISQHTLCPTIALYHLNVKFHLQIIFTLFHNDNILLQLISRTNSARSTNSIVVLHLLYSIHSAYSTVHIFVFLILKMNF